MTSANAKKRPLLHRAYTEAEKSGYAISLIREIAEKAKVEITNPATGRVTKVAPLHFVYEGSCYAFDPSIEIKNLIAKDVDINTPAAGSNYSAVRNFWLKEGLESLGPSGERVTLPYDVRVMGDRPKGSIPSASEIFQILAGPPPIPDRNLNRLVFTPSEKETTTSPYPMGAIDYKVFYHNRDYLAGLCHDAIIFFPCGGDGEKLAFILRDMAILGMAPRAIICNDTERQSLEAMCKIVSAVTSKMHNISGRPCEIPVIGVQGDWMDPKTYNARNITYLNIPPLELEGEGGIDSENAALINMIELDTLSLKNHTFLQSLKERGVLSAMKAEPAPTIIFEPGATANDFEQKIRLDFINNRKYFKPDMVSAASFDLTIDIDTLDYNYASHPLVRQLALTGITHKCWDELKKEGKEGLFDPRYIGVDIKAIPWGDKVNVQITLFEKLHPENRVDLTPIVKMEQRVYRQLLESVDMELLASFYPNDMLEPVERRTYCPLIISAPNGTAIDSQKRILHNNKLAVERRKLATESWSSSKRNLSNGQKTTPPAARYG